VHEPVAVYFVHGRTGLKLPLCAGHASTDDGGVPWSARYAGPFSSEEADDYRAVREVHKS
jgi:hypothetical protein